MQLIITEKNDVATKIADILAADRPKTESFLKVPYYLFTDREGRPTVAIGLKGHVLQVEFPEDYADWRKVDPAALIDAPLIKGETAKSVVRAVKRLAEKADSVVIATDFDREGELIGLEALEISSQANEKLLRNVRRAKFSSLTPPEVTHAFANLDYLSEPLAKAGEARQDIDLIWGATLTRFVSLATRRLGNQFLSVGRVQTPTLVLVVEREKERRAFVPEPYWVVTVDLRSPGAQPFTAVHKEDRFLDEERARSVFAKLYGPARVTSVKATKRQVARPAPFNTTSFMTAATSLGLSAAAAMRVAEGLYMGGYISYPRTDNTVYPSSLDMREILADLAQGRFGGDARRLLGKEKLSPSRGKKKTTDHPPIYPTAVLREGALDDRAHRIYELVVRRFFATLAEDAQSESTRIDLDVDGEPFVVRGTRVVEPGWMAYYPYTRQKDTEVPGLVEGDSAELVDKHLEAKETQPPSRYGQGTLIELMEKHNLGTKATRHNIIQNLYDRGYIVGNPVEPTETGIKMSEALQEFASRIASPEMTAELEDDMDAIAERSLSKEEVVEISRALLREAYGSLEKNREKVAGKILEGISDDKVLGDCPRCSQKLRVIRSKASKKRFVGCEGYPECEQTYPLPQRGDIIALNETCPQCGTPRIKVLGGKRPWTICLDPDCPTKDEYKQRAAGRARTGKGKSKGSSVGAKPSSGEASEDAAPAETKKSTAKKTGAKKTGPKKKTSAATPVGSVGGE